MDVRVLIPAGMSMQGVLLVFGLRYNTSHRRCLDRRAALDKATNIASASQAL